MRRTAMKRRPSPANPTAQRRHQVWERAEGCCERCGRGLFNCIPAWQCHHRMLRSQGGSNGFQNLAALCPSCHELVHSQRLEVGEPEGFIVSGHGVGPRDIPIEHWRLGRVLLSDSGSYEETL